jgi:hypothetical protein
MPELQYWFTSNAFFLLGSFIIASILGLIGVRTMISKRWIVLLICASIVITIVGWWTAARQEKDSTELKLAIGTAVKVDPNSSAQALAEELLRKLAEWHLTEKERQQLGAELDAIPENDRFPINIQALIGSNQSQMYKDDLACVFGANRWSVSGGVDIGLRRFSRPRHRCFSRSKDRPIPSSEYHQTGKYIEPFQHRI